MPELGTYGVVDTQGSVAAELEPLIEAIQLRGFAGLPGVLSSAEVERLNDLMDEIYARQCAEAGGEAALQSINDADIVRCMLAYDDAYMQVATHPVLTGLARAMLGDNVVLLMQNGIVNRPDRRQFQTNWHRDLNYQHWVSSRPLAISALVCLEDFNVETGGTVFLPGSHLAEHFPSPAIVAQSEETPDMPKGSVIFFNSMTFHRAGINRSGRIRRAVNHVIGAPILAQQVDLPSMLGGEPPADPWLSAYLGFRWKPPADVAAWRRQKILMAAPAKGAA